MIYLYVHFISGLGGHLRQSSSNGVHFSVYVLTGDYRSTRIVLYIILREFVYIDKITRCNWIQTYTQQEQERVLSRVVTSHLTAYLLQLDCARAA